MFTLDKLLWFYLSSDMGPAINPIVVTIKANIYIFGPNVFVPSGE